MTAEELTPDDESPIPFDDEDEEEVSLSLDEEQAGEAAEEEEEEEPIRLVDDEPSETGRSVKAFGSAAAGGVAKKDRFNRALNATGKGATRCRVFHSKIQESSLEYMENQINEWLDADETIEVKHVGHVIGTMEGKRPEPNVIVMVWY